MKLLQASVTILFLIFWGSNLLLAQSKDLVLKNGKIEIGGTLVLPEKDTKAPLVILISGSGAQDRDCLLYTSLLLFPFYLFSWLNNIIPYQPVRKIITKVIKDRAFDASIKFLIGLVLFPLFWVIVTSILLISGVPVLYALGYLLLSVITSVLFKNANLLIREMKERKRLKLFRKDYPEEYDEFVKGIKVLNEFRREVL